LTNTIRVKSGFTLLEVLIALAIFAVAGLVCLQAYLSSIRHVQIMTEEKNYLLLSIMKIEEFKMEPLQDAKESSGTFPQPFESYEWSIELSGDTITDTECEMSFTPYRLKVSQQNREFSTIAPLVKTLKQETAQRIQ